MSWTKFDKEMNQNFLNNVNDLSKTATYEELPLGKYEVAITSMELKESKKGNPMVTTVFKVLKGQYKGRLIFKNQVIYMGDENDKYRIQAELRFLKSLTTSQEIVFNGLESFDKLIGDVFDEIESHSLEFLLEIGKKNGFRNYKIKEVFDTPF